MYVTAKLTGKIQAIKLTEDVMAECGDYLLIDERDGITVMSENDFNKWFQTPQTQNKPNKFLPAPKRASNRAIDPNGSILNNADSPYMKIILAFGPTGDGSFLSNLASHKLADITGMNRTNVSPAMPSLFESGYVARYRKGKEFYYSLTDQGRSMNRRIRAKKNPAG